jgi:hypothetical protein
MHNLYSILKIPDDDVLLVRQLHSVSPALLPLGVGSNMSGTIIRGTPNTPKLGW